MDPLSFIVVCVALWGILQRAPGLIGEAVAEFQAGRHGETTQAVQDRRQRLIDAGVDPASAGGPLRQFLGNAWRDHWHDKDQDRQRKRAEAEAGRHRSWWQRRMDAALDRQASKYRGDPATPEPAGEADEHAGPDGTDTRQGDPPRPKPPGSQPDPQDPPPGATQPADDNTEPSGGHGAGDQGFGPREEPAEARQPPIRVDVTVGDPVGADTQPRTAGTATAVLDRPAPAQIEGNPMGNAVANKGTAITGVLSGSYEMLSINRQLEAATQAFVGQLTTIQHRLNRAGESTIGTVQMSTGSTVMARMAQAAEAVAALRAAATTCGAEVSPLLLRTKAEFDRRNS